MSDLRSRVLGTIFGTLSRGTFPSREPVAFLYNGVRLPGLPVVEGKENAVIISSFGTTYLFLSSVKLDYRYITAHGYMLTSKHGETFICFSFVRYKLNKTAGDWSGGTYSEDSTFFALGSTEAETVWSNADLYHYDKDTDEATLVCAASEPVPVYE